jgi:hypothetical protein
MEGSILFPLNTLKNVLPQVYEEHNRKYKGREQVKENKIPGIGKWNDAIHLSPVDPSETRQALRDAGVDVKNWRVFCIDVGTLDKSRMVIHIESRAIGNSEAIDLPFTDELYASYHHLPDRTKEYYRECIDMGRRILMYAYAPHVLYGGSIDVSGVDIKEYTN